MDGIPRQTRPPVGACLRNPDRIRPHLQRSDKLQAGCLLPAKHRRWTALYWSLDEDDHTREPAEVRERFDLIIRDATADELGRMRVAWSAGEPQESRKEPRWYAWSQA